MQNYFNTIAIIGKYMAPKALQQMQADLVNLAQHLQSRNINVYIEKNTALHAPINGFKTIGLDEIGEIADLAIVMGGDGTMLSVARSLIDADVPLVGINRGRFGFLTDLRAEEMLVAVDRILAGGFSLEPRMLLATQVIRDGKVLHANYALNDAVIKSDLRLIELEV